MACAEAIQQDHVLPVDVPSPGAFLKGYSVLQAPPTVSLASSTRTCEQTDSQGHWVDVPSTESLLLANL